MPNIQLHIPVLIQQEANTFTARPLFLPYPVVDHSRFDNVLSVFRSRIQKIFKGFTLNRESAEILFWYHFTPTYELKRYTFRYTIKKIPVEGSFSVVHFEMDGKMFLSFPAFDNYLAMIGRDEKGKVKIKEEAETIIEHLLLREYHADPENFSPQHYLALKREFVTDVTQEIYVSEEPYKFNRLPAEFPFRFFRRPASFKGIDELNKVGHALNDYYPHRLRRAYYREEIVEELLRVLFRGIQTPLVIIGPEGSGRHSVLEEALRRHILEVSGKKERQQKIWFMDPTRVISGMSVVGMWEKRLEAMLDFIRSSGQGGPNDKIMVDNPVALARIGRSASNDLGMSQVLKPYLEKRQIQLVLIATTEEWKVVQEKDRAFSDLFQVIRIQPPAMQEGFQMVMEQRRLLEAQYHCQFSIQAIGHLFTTYRNFFRTKALPGVIVKWLQQLAVKYQGRMIDYEEVLAEFKGISGFREQLLDPNTTFDIAEVEQQIARSLVGQEEAVQALANAIHLIKARLNDPSQPLASYLFIGPTGVGKTQAAKVLARFLTGNTEQLIRFDMNEYVDPYAAVRLVGDFARPEGELISKVRYQPFGILLLDEIEKAHRHVHDILLQVLDDGRLTDGRGRTVDFSNTIIIMTSNLGAREVSYRLGFGKNQADDAAIYVKEVRKHFRPEFINRIDRMVVFNPLTLEHTLDIARIQIEELLQRDGFVRRTTMVNIDPKALDWVAQRGFDNKKGGRALKRQIERDLTTLTAEQLIGSKGDTPILFDILLKDQALVPKITPLDFATPLEHWLPEFPGEKQAKAFYEKLLVAAEQLERGIRRSAEAIAGKKQATLIITGEEKNLNWALFQAKDQARELKERLKIILLDFQDYQLQQAPAIPFRLKLTPQSKGDPDQVRKRLQDLFFQKQALNELYLEYQFGASRFDSVSTELLQDYLDVAFLRLTSLALQKKQPDQGYFRIESYQSGRGKEQIKMMLQWYRQLLEAMQVPVRLDMRNQQLEVEGYGLADLLRAEEGIHLFFIAREAPLPLTTYWIPKGDKGYVKPTHRTILRLYDENRTITDLRSGFTNTFHLSPGEMKVLLYAGLPEDLRKSVLPE